jgi:ankyrin repeat protein
LKKTDLGVLGVEKKVSSEVDSSLINDAATAGYDANEQSDNGISRTIIDNEQEDVFADRESRKAHTVTDDRVTIQNKVIIDSETNKSGSCDPLVLANKSFALKLDCLGNTKIGATPKTTASGSLTRGNSGVQSQEDETFEIIEQERSRQESAAGVVAEEKKFRKSEHFGLALAKGLSRHQRWDGQDGGPIAEYSTNNELGLEKRTEEKEVCADYEKKRTKKERQLDPIQAQKKGKSGRQGGSIDEEVPESSYQKKEVTSPKRKKYTLSNQVVKIKQSQIPHISEPPDWLFRPEDSKAKGALNIRGDIESERRKDKAAARAANRIAREKEKMDQLKQCIDTHKGKKKANSMCKENKYVGELKDTMDRIQANKLFKLMNFDPWSENTCFSDNAVRRLIVDFPASCRVMYEIDGFAEPLYPLSVLCTLGASLSTIETCFKANPDAMEEADDWLGTPLHYACSYKAHHEVVQFIVQECPDLVAKLNRFRRTPLHMACLFNAPETVVSFLIDRNPLATQLGDKEGLTPLHLACDSDAELEVIQILTNEFSLGCVARSNIGSTPLHLALGQHAQLGVIRTLVEAHHSALEMVDDLGQTPLHVCVLAGADLKTVKFLVKCFPDGIHSENRNGETPLDIAERAANISDNINSILSGVRF